MKVDKIQLIGSCLAIGLVLVLTMSACSSSSTAVTTTTSQAASSNTMASGNTTVKTTSSSSSSKTTTTGKVTAALVSIAITPNQPYNLELGASTITFIATGTYSDGSTADISSLATWHSSDPTIAEFDQLSGGQ
ncbi:MAG: hypothetical protein WAK43_03125, partial [Dehalococcoidales bacterium]